MVVAGAGAASSSRASSWRCCCTGDLHSDHSDDANGYSTMLDRGTTALPPSSPAAPVAPDVQWERDRLTLLESGLL
jgi:hypothetical protein